ncbi:MAG TPA: AraC family transcriptional regulator [Acidobacteriota bacterium]|nr:AraC family transcriptional regulator [Acidobacteriota bacterium]
MHKLDPGCYCGRIVGSRQGDGFLLTETVYSAQSRIPRHSHHHPYLCLIRQGHYRERYGERERECRPHMLAFHPAGEEHSEDFGRHSVRSFNIELQDNCLGFERLTDHQLGRPAEMRGGRSAWAAHQLYREFSSWDGCSPMAAQGLLTLIMADLWRYAESGRPLRKPEWLRQAREIIESALGEKLTIAQVARKVGVHPVYLCDQFRRFYDCTPGEFQRRRRIQRSSRQLRESNRPLAQIALDNGFSDQSHFTRVFKEATGLTPGKYRRHSR